MRTTFEPWALRKCVWSLSGLNWPCVIPAALSSIERIGPGLLVDGDLVIVNPADLLSSIERIALGVNRHHPPTTTRFTDVPFLFVETTFNQAWLTFSSMLYDPSHIK
ncbi:hypothetical protein K492DRAFT_9349 [Lichtheimia hyalospora FSU 10163]|nr:hypothetical protein K492DRAFT_9349 [Lichtheimia hyalospora FSU 10163]